VHVAGVPLATHAAARRVASEALPLPGAAFVPVEMAGVPMVPQPEPLGPGVVEVVGPAGFA